MNQPKDAGRAPVHAVVHTPGPWKSGRSYRPGDPKTPVGSIGIVGNENSKIVCQMPWRDNGEDLANVQLIVNAPAMLEALRKIVRYMEANQGEGTTVWYVASEAIKEATEVV